MNGPQRRWPRDLVDRPECGTNADASARPTVEVRSGGQLIRRVAVGAAESLVSRGWAEWIGTGRRRYIQLTSAAPLSNLPNRHGWHGSDNTRPMRADGRQVCAAGQVLGEPRSHREHIPIARGAERST